jgi:hypothetical protein
MLIGINGKGYGKELKNKLYSLSFFYVIS